MALQETVQKNHNRLREISVIHQKEVDTIDHYLRIIHQAKIDKIEALARKHDVLVKQMKAEIDTIEIKIADEVKHKFAGSTQLAGNVGIDDGHIRALT